MTNSALMHKALKYRELRAQMKALEKDAKDLSDEVVAELAKQGLTTLEHKGITVTVKASTRVNWVANVLRTLVTRATYGRVAHEEIDNDLMKAEIKAGRILAADVQSARTESTGSPYIVVTGDAAA